MFRTEQYFRTSPNKHHSLVRRKLTIGVLFVGCFFLFASLGIFDSTANAECGGYVIVKGEKPMARHQLSRTESMDAFSANGHRLDKDESSKETSLELEWGNPNIVSLLFPGKIPCSGPNCNGNSNSNLVPVASLNKVEIDPVRKTFIDEKLFKDDSERIHAIREICILVSTFDRLDRPPQA